MYDIIDPDGTRWEMRARAAEKTVGVLKSKVRELYDGGGSGSLQEQIERMRAKQQEAREKRKLMEVQNAALQKHAETLEAVVAERTRSLRNILDNVTFGFVIVDRGWRVQEGFTRSCSSLFGRDLQVGESLLSYLGVDEGKALEMELSFDQLFEDIFPPELTLGQMPSRYEIDGRVLKLEGSALRDDEGTLYGVLMTTSDITAFEATKRENVRNRVIIQILQQRAAFEEFVLDVHEMLSVATQKLDDQPLVRRLVHTVKGNSASFGLESVAHTCHLVENRDTIGREGLLEVHHAMRAFLDDIRDVVDIAYGEQAQQKIEVDARHLDRLFDLLDPEQASPAVLAAANDIRMRPASELIGPMDSFAVRLAERLDKAVTFDLVGTDTPVHPRVLRPVLRTVSHLVRNAIDHGLEFPDERGDKPELGTVSLRIASDESGYLVEVADDGRGIDGERLAAKAVDMGVVSEERMSQMTERERVELVFANGLSTAEATTDISGRGVGMSAVKEAVESQGGRIEIHSTPGEGTRFQLYVPHAA